MSHLVVFHINLFKLLDDPKILYFDHNASMWKCPSPSKVKVLKWLIFLGKDNTLDQIQSKFSRLCFSHNWCVLCKRSSKDSDNLYYF